MALAVIACALFLRILVPQGWMPAETAKSWWITPCSGSGPMPMDMTAGMKRVSHGPASQDHGSADHPCAFSSLSMALDEPPQLVLDLPKLVVAGWSAGVAMVVGIGLGLAAPPPPATGPPLA